MDSAQKPIYYTGINFMSTEIFAVNQSRQPSLDEDFAPRERSASRGRPAPKGAADQHPGPAHDPRLGVVMPTDAEVMDARPSVASAGRNAHRTSPMATPVVALESFNSSILT